MPSNTAQQCGLVEGAASAWCANLVQEAHMMVWSTASSFTRDPLGTLYTSFLYTEVSTWGRGRGRGAGRVCMVWRGVRGG